MSEELIKRLLEHAAMHEQYIPFDDEQAQFAKDLREAAALARPAPAVQVPEGGPLRKLGKRLAELLDEDQFAECEALLLAASPAGVGGWMPEPDMCWSADNPEDSNGDPEQIADYEVDGIGLTSNDDPVYIEVLCAKSLPSRQMKVWVEKLPDGNDYTMWEFMPLTAAPAIANQEPQDGR